MTKNKIYSTKQDIYHVLSLGSCLSNSIIRQGKIGTNHKQSININCLGFIRFFRIDSINNYLFGGASRNNFTLLNSLINNQEETDRLAQQYYKNKLGSSFDHKKIFKDQKDLIQTIKKCDAIIMDTFWDVRAKLILANDSHDEPVFIHKNSISDLKKIKFCDKLSEQNIKDGYIALVNKINILNPKCKIIVANFTGMHDLKWTSKGKRIRLQKLDNYMKYVGGKNFYYISSQKLDKKDYSDYNKTRTLDNHLTQETYQRYFFVIADILTNKAQYNYFDKETLKRLKRKKYGVRYIQSHFSKFVNFIKCFFNKILYK